MPDDKLYQELQRVVLDELTDGGTALKPFTTGVAKEFHSLTPREIIEDPYFLDAKNIIYPFQLNIIEQLYTEKKNRKIDLVIMIEGIGGGKTYAASVLEYLEWFYFTTTPNPVQAFPFVDVKNSTTAFILMSRTKEMARKVVFTNVYRMFQSQFNKEYFPPNPTIKTYLDIPRNHTIIWPGTGEAVSALGFNGFSGIIDEAAFLQQAAKDSSSAEVEDQAQAMYEQMHGRIYSRFGDNGGLVILITSANKVDNWVESKITDAMKYGNERDRIFWVRAPYWKCKPKEFFKSGRKFLFNAKTLEIITDEDMIDEYFLARSRLELSSDFNPILGGLLI